MQQAQDYSLNNLKRTPSCEEMDLSVKRMKMESPKTHGKQMTTITPVPITSSMIPLMKSDVIKKELLESADHDNMSQHSDSNDSSDSGRLQMDISSQEDTEENRNLSLNRIGGDTPESLISEEHGFEAPDVTQLWQTLAHHSSSECSFFHIFNILLIYFIFLSERRNRSYSTVEKNDQLSYIGNPIQSISRFGWNVSRSTNRFTKGLYIVLIKFL